MTICKQMIKKRWKRKTIRNNQEELKDVWNILEIMFCISSHVFFKELFLDYSVVKKNHMLFVAFFHEIARMLKNFVVTQAIVLEISKALHRVWCNSVLYKLVFLFVFYLTEPLYNGKAIWIFWNHKSLSNCPTNVGMPQTFLFSNLCFEWAKES